MVIPDISRLLENLDVKEIAEGLGIDAGRSGVLSVFKPYSYRLTCWELGETELQQKNKTFKIFTLQGRGGYGLSGNSTYIWATGDCTVWVTLEDSYEDWGEIRLRAFEVWDKNFVRKRIRWFSILVDRETGSVDETERVDNIGKLFRGRCREGTLGQTEMQEVWGNFRNLRNPFDPKDSRYPAKRGGILGAILP